MCPACIASTAVMLAGAGSTGGILAVCIGKLRKFFRANRPGLFQETQGRGEIRLAGQQNARDWRKNSDPLIPGMRISERITTT
jgi:hypothetical protein